MRARRDDAAYVGHELAQGDRPQVDAPLARVGTDELEEVVDEREPMRAGTAHRLRVHGGVAGLELDHLEPRVDGDEGRAQVVAERVQEGRERLGGLLGLEARRFELCLAQRELLARRGQLAHERALSVQRHGEPVDELLDLRGAEQHLARDVERGWTMSLHRCRVAIGHAVSSPRARGSPWEIGAGEALIDQNPCDRTKSRPKAGSPASRPSAPLSSRPFPAPRGADERTRTTHG
ncbi:MAG: hypothetical protein ACO3QC_05320 [Phycisphaerales bacterium]